MRMQQFTKNIGVIGGLLLLAAHGASAFSLDYRNSGAKASVNRNVAAQIA